MNDAKKAALAAIDEKKELVAEVADAIWDYAELSMQEVKSAALFVKVLKAEGFQVEEGICGIPTAFSASFGSGGPVIGLLAEYDALSGLSQAAGSTAYHELVKGGSGHGCGHNLLGAGAMAAAIGLKHYLTQTGKSGTVILYGCPGEEGVASKAYMAREGLWYGLDAALTWHPGDSSEVTTGSTNSCIQMIYTFHGLASQASTAPERGRSALDAVELMNVGVQFLREHMPRDARVHYSILDAGGVSPNVVQHQASVLYMIRSNFVKDCMALHQRVDKIAQGAALMTDTTIERRFVDGLSDTVCNHALEKVLYDNFSQLGVPPCTAEEHAFMEALSATYEGRDVPGGVGAENDPAFAEKVKAMQTGHFNDFLMPLYQGPAFNAGSTDVGDVSYQCPTAQIHVAVWPNHVPCHSWQVVSCNKTPMAHKATVHAGKVLCAAAIDLLEQPALLEAAKAEFRQHQRRRAQHPGQRVRQPPAAQPGEQPVGAHDQQDSRQQQRHQHGGILTVVYLLHGVLPCAGTVPALLSTIIPSAAQPVKGREPGTVLTGSPRLRVYASRARSLSYSWPLTLLNSASRSGTVSRAFSSPEVSSTIRPLCSISRRLP